MLMQATWGRRVQKPGPQPLPTATVESPTRMMRTGAGCARAQAANRAHRSARFIALRYQFWGGESVDFAGLAGAMRLASERASGSVYRGPVALRGTGSRLPARGAFRRSAG